MNLEEYNKQLKELEKKHSDEKFLLAKEYAMSNRTADIGDMITNGTETILITHISISMSSYSAPACVYKGKLLKKDLTPRADGSTYAMWQEKEPMTKITKKQ